jgi:acetyltransferase-like isoleucine patch superfamily enzyme
VAGEASHGHAANAGTNTSGQAGRLICGSDLFAGEGLIFAPGIPEEYMRFKLAPIILEDFATICGSVTILPGVRIAEGSVVGAGSLVVRDTEPWTIYAGSPAQAVRRRLSKHMLEYAKKLGYPFA